MEFYHIKVQDGKAQIYIFGDIEQSSLAAEINDLEVEAIEVYINSYGGQVAEGLAVYNALASHKAKVTTICTGFACSSASTIFMAGEQRIMQDSTILMIHNAWVLTAGDHKDLNQTAEWLEKVSIGIKNIYIQVTGLDEETLTTMMDNETWLTPSEAIKLGFATEESDTNNSVRNQITNKIKEPVKTETHFMSLFKL